jgi:hypothetical protein
MRRSLNILAFKIQIIVPMQIIKICSTPNYWHLIFKAPFFYFLNQFRLDRKWLYPFQWLKSRPCDIRWIFVSNPSEGGPVDIWEEMIMKALLHMAGLENSECIWKIQHKVEVFITISMLYKVIKILQEILWITTDQNIQVNYQTFVDFLF